MRKFFFLVSIALLPALIFAQGKDKKEIMQLLDRQVSDWNRGDIDSFMVGYWNSDSLMFIGQSGVTYGYNATKANYKKNYSDTAQMGKLNFDILHVTRLSPNHFFVVGKWFLKRSVGDVKGHFTLIFKKIGGRWVIVSDHSS